MQASLKPAAAAAPANRLASPAAAAAEEIEYSTSEDEDTSTTETSSTTESASTTTESSSTTDDEEDQEEEEDGIGDELDIEHSQRLPVASLDEVDLARKRKAIDRLSTEDVQGWQRDLRQPKLPRVDASDDDDDPTLRQLLLRPDDASERPVGRSLSEADFCDALEPPDLEELAEQGRRLAQANNSSVVPVAEAASEPAVEEEALAVERVSTSAYKFSPAGQLDDWRGGGSVQAVASSRARVTNSTGDQLSLGDSEDQEGSSGSETFVTTEASGACPSAAIARATARAASIASATLTRGRPQGSEEYRIFISTSCTVKPSVVLDPSRLQITVSSDSDHQKPEQQDDQEAGDAKKKRAISSPRRLDSRDSSENVFSLLRMGRQDTTHETVTQELPSPAGGDSADYADFEAATRSVIQDRYSTERREDLADEYCRRASKAVQAEVKLMEELKAAGPDSSEAVNRMGRMRSDQERFLELKRQLDALKARQLARQRQQEVLRSPTSTTETAADFPMSPTELLQQHQQPLGSPGSLGDRTLQNTNPNMVESAYITDSDPSSPTAAEKPLESRPPYRSVLQESVAPAGPRRDQQSHSSLQLDQERLQRARNEYYRRPVFGADLTKRPSYAGSTRTESPSDFRNRSASSTLSKSSSCSMYQLRELLDDRSALQTSKLTSTGRRRYMSTDIDQLMDDQHDGAAVGASTAGSSYDLNAFDTEPGNYKSVSLFDLRRSMLTDMQVAAAAAPTNSGANGNEAKSYVSLIETDIDTGEEVSQEAMLETDVDLVDESPLSPQPKSQSLMNLATPRPSGRSGIFADVGTPDPELDRRLNKANSEDFLESGATPTTVKKAKAGRSNSRRSRKPESKTFIQRLEERATSESEKNICKSLSRLDIPKWMDNLQMNRDITAAKAKDTVDSHRPWSKHSSEKREEPEDQTDDSDMSLKPLIIPKFVSLPSRPSLFSPGYSSVAKLEAREETFEWKSATSERSKPPGAYQKAPTEQPRKYFTESTIRRDSMPAAPSSAAAAAAAAARSAAQKTEEVRRPRLSLAPGPALEPLRLNPDDFLSKTEKSKAIPELSAAPVPEPLTAAVSRPLDSAVLTPRAPLETDPSCSVKSASSQEDVQPDNEGHDSDASTMMFIDLSVMESSEAATGSLRPLQDQHGDTSTTVSTDFNSGGSSLGSPRRMSLSGRSGSASDDEDETTESSGTSEDSSEDSSTSETSSESHPSGSEGDSEESEEDEVVEEEKTPVKKQLTNGSLTAPVLASVPAKNAPAIKQQQRQPQSTSSSSEESSSSSSGAETEEATVIETSVVHSRLLQRNNSSGNRRVPQQQQQSDRRLLACQSDRSTLSYADGLALMEQTEAAVGYADRNLSIARRQLPNAAGLTEALKAAAKLFPAADPQRWQQRTVPPSGRRSPPVSFDEVLEALSNSTAAAPGGEQNRGVIREAGRYLVECVNPRCARRSELLDARRSYRSCSNCYTYYCSAECRQDHWSAHRRVCLFARAGAACRAAARGVLVEPRTHGGLSALARAGHRNLGRGCVLLLFASPVDAAAAPGTVAPLRPPAFVPTAELAACGLSGEQLRETAAACRDFDPSNAFVLCVAACVGAEYPKSAASASGPLVASWAVLGHAEAAAPQSSEAAASAATSAAAAEAEQRREQQLRMSREDLLARVRKELRQRGVSLRHHYPGLLAVLQEFVATGVDFPTQTVYPVDTTNGRTFQYDVSPGADPVTRWVQPPRAPPRRPKPPPAVPPPLAPQRRSVMSTDL